MVSSTDPASERDSDHGVVRVVAISVLSQIPGRHRKRDHALTRLAGREEDGHKQDQVSELDELVSSTEGRMELGTNELHDHNVPRLDELAGREHRVLVRGRRGGGSGGVHVWRAGRDGEC